MLIRGPYGSMQCRVNGVLVEFKNFLADVPETIANTIIHNGRGSYILVKDDSDKNIMLDEFNTLISRIKSSRKYSNLLVTVSIGETHKKLGDVTIPTMQAYCKKYNIDFVNINIQDPTFTPYWQRYRLVDLLDTYDRIAYFDDDIIIRDTTPNIFDIVPEDHVALYQEGKYPSTIWKRTEYCTQCFKTYLEDILSRTFDPDKFKGEQYYNNGLIVFSKMHRDLFKVPKVATGIDWQHDPSTKGSRNVCGDQTNLNINLIDSNYKVFELKPPLVGLFDRVPDGIDYTKCHIVHFAFGGMNAEKIQQIKLTRDQV